MWIRSDNQDVGLEAATIQRVRNSSLVEWVCAENDRGSSLTPKLRMRRNPRGRGAFHGRRSRTGRYGGGHGRENAGMSSEKTGENPVRRKPEVS